MQALERLIAVLHALAAGPEGGLRLTDIAAFAGLDKATAGRFLGALCKERIVARNAVDKNYLLGPELVFLGLAAERSFDLGKMLHPPLTRLAAKTGDCSYLVIRSGNFAVCYGKAVGSYPVQAQVVQVGVRRPLGVGGTGLALLASLADEEIDRILEENSEVLSNYPHYSNERLLREIAEMRDRGYALVKSYLTEDVQTLGFPICNPQGQCIAGISIATISARLANGRKEFIADSVREAAKEAEESLRAAMSHHVSAELPSGEDD